MLISNYHYYFYYKFYYISFLWLLITKFYSENYWFIIDFRFYKDSVSTSYERQVFALLDVFGNIGGVNEILEISGGLIVGIFSGKIFLFSLISSLYQVDSTHISTNSYYNK